MVGIPRGRQPHGPEPRGRGQGQLERHPLGQGGFGLAGGHQELGPRTFSSSASTWCGWSVATARSMASGHFQAAAHRAGHLEPENAGDAPPPGRQGFSQGQEVP